MSTSFDELDTLARRATATLVADAPDDAETEAALLAVKSGTPSVVPMTPRVTRNRARVGRMPVLVAGAAAAVIAVGIACVIAISRPESSPSGPAVSPEPTAAPVSPSVPPPTVPSTFEPQPGPFTLTVTPGQTGPREVLYAAGVGSGDQELGMEQCDDCESERPHDPIITADGTVVIFDMANHRWVVVGRGPVPIDPAIDMFELEAGRDGFIYTSAKVDGGDSWSVVVWDPARLEEPVDVIPTESDDASLALLATDDGITYVGGESDYVGPETTPLGSLAENNDGATRTLVRTYPNGETTTWIVPDGWNTQLPAGLLPDGSAMLDVFTGDEMWLLRLFPDGRSLAMPPVHGDGVWASPALTLDGVAVIQRVDDGFEVARYPLPSAIADGSSGAPTTTPPSRTVETTVAPASTPFVVTTEVGALTTPELLYHAGIGTAVDRLGLDACQECEQRRPFEPVVTRDGTIFIVDGVNLRIVSVAVGIPSAWPLPAGFSPQALALGHDGVLYIGGEFGVGSPSRRTAVLAYSTDSMVAPLQEIPYGGSLAGHLRAAPSGLAAGGSAGAVIPYIGDSETARHPGIELSAPSDGEIRALTVRSTTGAATAWALTDGWTFGGLAAALDYPEAVIAAQGPDGQGIFARLLADGTSVAMPWVGGDGNGSPPFIDERGIVVLEQTDDGFDVVRYPLPG